jgi:hypothetical protein
MIKKKALILAVTVSLFLILPFFVGSNPRVNALETWLEGWDYRKELRVSSDASLGSNAVLNFTVYWGSGTDTNETIYLDQRSQLDFDDLRITNGDMELIDCYADTETGVNANVFVRIPLDLSLADYTVFIYYGNTTVSNVWSAPDTFRDYITGVVQASTYDNNTLDYAISNNGAMVGAPNPTYTTSGVYYDDLNFTGSGWIRHTTTTEYNFTSEFTLYSWVYHYNTLGYTHFRTSAGYGYWMEVTGGGNVQTFLYINGSSYGLGWYGSTTGNYNNLAITYNATSYTLQIWLNGSSVASRSDLGGNVTQANQDLDIGAGFNSRVDHPLMFNSEMNSSQMSNLYNYYPDPELIAGSVCLYDLDNRPQLEYVGEEEDDLADIQEEAIFGLIGVVLAVSAMAMALSKR